MADKLVKAMFGKAAGPKKRKDTFNKGVTKTGTKRLSARKLQAAFNSGNIKRNR
jgi:hypothetical protein